MQLTIVDGQSLQKQFPDLIYFFAEKNSDFLYDVKNQTLIDQISQEDKSCFLPLVKIFHDISKNYMDFSLQIIFENKTLIMKGDYSEEIVRFHSFTRNFDVDVLICELQNKGLEKLLTKNTSKKTIKL